MRWWGDAEEGWGDRGRARATIQQERTHLPHLASEWHTSGFSLASLLLRNYPSMVETCSDGFVRMSRRNFGIITIRRM